MSTLYEQSAHCNYCGQQVWPGQMDHTNVTSDPSHQQPPPKGSLSKTNRGMWAGKALMMDRE